MLKLENIVKNYSDKKVIDHVSLKLKNGVYGLLGPNGAGKTTLLNIICGVVKPSSGNLYFNDKNILSNRGLLLDQIGYLPQNFNYYPSFTALEFLIYMGLLKGIKSNLEEKCWELLELVGLTVEANNKIKTFSGGMKQRLGIAQSLLNDPHLLVLDEPTVGLDPNERIKFRHLISSLGNQKTVILSTHIISDVESIANNIIILKEGKILENENIAYYLKQLEGKVWEVSVATDIVEKLPQDLIISNQKIDSGTVHLRIISPIQPVNGAILVSPHIEDIYLNYFPSQKR
ncbi:ABC transporter ATP-binding protein [Streptococcus thoraltensis]|uniref:ABC transporter ATP-binding protein n=1 Tax=Streptococcus thoraltensis TaxID=55085 RepID=UPI001F57BE14|nr:ABC transporter ATP-binding protein [Streptococcus thoraltensis]